MNNEQRDVCLKLLSLFKFGDKRADEIFTEGQIQIFFELIFRPHKRLHIMTSTQYGNLWLWLWVVSLYLAFKRK